MIKAAEVQRDECGSWAHPEWDRFCGEREVIPRDEVTAWENENGLKVRILGIECLPDGHPALMAYEDCEQSLDKWELTPPRDDCFLLSAHDTEDGPVQVWACPWGYADLRQLFEHRLQGEAPMHSDRMVLQLLDELEAATDYAESKAVTLDLLAKAMGVPDEPHQGKDERIVEAAEGLAAHVERQQEAMGCLLSVIELAWSQQDQQLPEVKEARATLADKPATSLARREAETRGTALREIAAHIYNGEMSPSQLAKWCLLQDQEVRRQAEEGLPS